MTELEVRPAADHDDDAVVSLLAASMGQPDDDRMRRLLRWKHTDNPFGRSPAWVAVEGDTVVGYRAFLRWEFEGGAAGPERAVRAVDTATAPTHQGRGVFRNLTMHGLEALADEGVAFVFNTPNDNSRPGYLKMGWQEVGSLRPRLRPRSLLALPTIARSRAPAGLFGEPCSVGTPASEAFDADDVTAALLGSAGPVTGLRTRRSPSYLRWRYEADLLGYRVLTLGRDLQEGAICFRLRRRGSGIEATIGDVLAPGDDTTTRRRLIKAVLAGTRAHYALLLDGDRGDRTFPMPGQGPTLTWRSVTAEAAPALEDWHLTMGDIELF